MTNYTTTVTDAKVVYINIMLIYGRRTKLTSGQRRRPGAEFGGRKHFFAGQDFWMTFFSAKISDDFFSRRPRFSDFPFLIPDFLYLYYVKCRIWPFPTQQKHLFLLCSCSYFRAHPTTLLLETLVGWMHGPSPHLKFFGGTVPPRSPPLHQGSWI